MEALYKKQLDFIGYLQRLLQEGDFTATYKFALLHAIADICIEKKVTENGKLKISYGELVDKFIMLYWQHSKPFYSSEVIDTSSGVLLQNGGRQAKIILDIMKLQNEGIRNLSQAKTSKLWKEVYRSTLKTLKDGPLWRLQILSKQDDCFLYPHTKSKDINFIELNAGIAHSFSYFHDIVVQFARQGWIDKISKIPVNQKIVGKAGELSDFLFETSRSSLKPAADFLNDLQMGTCFYCQKPIKSNAEVDHFIPFSKYSNDLAHNFVLAHKSCNNNKRDYLAAPKHKDRWVEQNLVVNTKDIIKELSPFYVCDERRSLYVANWAYDLADKNGSKYWLSVNEFV